MLEPLLPVKPNDQANNNNNNNTNYNDNDESQQKTTTKTSSPTTTTSTPKKGEIGGGKVTPLSTQQQGKKKSIKRKSKIIKKKNRAAGDDNDSNDLTVMGKLFQNPPTRGGGGGKKRRSILQQSTETTTATTGENNNDDDDIKTDNNNNNKNNKRRNNNNNPKSMLYTILNPKSKQYPAVIFRYFISIVIIVDFVFFLLSTEPMFNNHNSQQQQQELQPPPTTRTTTNFFKTKSKVKAAAAAAVESNIFSDDDDSSNNNNYYYYYSYHNIMSELFNIIEGISSSIFLLEYCFRIYTITESTKYGCPPNINPLLSRLKYMMTPYMIIDFFATTPFFVELLTGWDLPTLTYLRTFRLAKLMESSQGFAQAADAVFRVLYYNRQIMYLSIHVGFMMIITTSILLFYFRPPDSHDSQEFQSILSTMYLACLMLTGQGGPDGDLPWYTKSVVLLTSAFSIGMFAIPVSMLTWGFEAEAERCAKRTRQLAKRKEAMNKVGGDSNSHFETFDYSTDEYSTDEEYQKIIAGEEEEEDDTEKDDPMLSLFCNLDSDDSGSLSLREFIDHMKSNNNGSGGGITNNNIDGVMSARISVLEKKIDDIASKVDRLCDALASTKK